jgi:8-oxo-dGTP pyrophosphatase MutT (NUDIX family)
MTEYLPIVDENDEITGKASWPDIREKNLLHRGTGIIIFNSKKEIFVHQRALAMKKDPGLYAVFVGGGVAFGESYDEAAVRELLEETGIAGALLNFLFKTKYEQKDNRAFVQIYSCRNDSHIRMQEEEIMDGFFVSLKKLKELMKKKEFTRMNIKILDEYMKEYHKNDPAIKNI